MMCFLLFASSKECQRNIFPVYTISQVINQFVSCVKKIAYIAFYNIIYFP